MSPARFARTAAALALALAVWLLCLQAQEPAKPGKPDNPGKPASADKPADKPDKPDKPAEPPLSPGDELVRQALENLNKLGWIATNIRQEIKIGGLTIEARGRYVYATGDRVLHELETAVAGSKGATRLVCDGRDVWRISQLGVQKSIQRYEQTQLKEPFKDSEEGDEIKKGVYRETRDEIMAAHGFVGVRALLEDLRQRMRFTLREPTVLPAGAGKSVPVFLLEGEWTAKSVEFFVPKGNDPATNKPYAEGWEKREAYINLPRKCRLFLGKAGAAELWPYRVEWLGPVRPGGEDELITAIDLRDPVLAAEPPADADKTFVVKLTPEEEKLVERVSISEVIKTSLKDTVNRREEQERARSGARTLDPTKLDSPGKPSKPRELIPPGKPLDRRP